MAGQMNPWKQSPNIQRKDQMQNLANKLTAKHRIKAHEWHNCTHTHTPTHPFPHRHPAPPPLLYIRFLILLPAVLAVCAYRN